MNNLLVQLPPLALLAGGGLLALVGLVTGWRRLRRDRQRRALYRSLNVPGIQKEVFKNKAIGLHRTTGLLVWADATGPLLQQESISLKGVVGCTLGLTGYRAGEGIKDIFLELILKDGTVQRLYFFRDGHDSARSKIALYRKAKYWKRLIGTACRPHRAGDDEAVGEEW